MRFFVLRRLPSAVVTVFVASIVIFACIRLVPGDPVASVLGEDSTPAAAAAVRHEMRLDKPLVVQYLDWLGGLFTGHLGRSYVSGASIGQLLRDGAVPTIQLAVAGMVVTVVVGAALGIGGALATRRWTSATVHTVNTVLNGTPEYIFAVTGVLVLAVGIRLLPAGGRASLIHDPVIGFQYLILPAVSLGLHSASIVARFLESALRRTMAEEFVDAARMKGISTARLVWRHALPNSLPTVLTVLGLRLGHLLGGAVVIEAIFNWHGLGQVLVTAVDSRDYRIVQDLVLLSVVVFIVVQVLTDLAHAALDPRLRESAT